MPQVAKRCTACAVEKPLDDFNRHAKGKHGRDSKCKSCRAARRRTIYHQQPEKFQAMRRQQAGRLAELHRIRTYGLDQQAFDSLLTSQGSGCAVCGEQNRRFVIDHDHVTGQTRGILCYSCNMALGMAGDSRERLIALVAYLDNPPFDQLAGSS